MKKRTTTKPMQKRFKVDVWERDSWSGPSLLRTVLFCRESAANKYAAKINSKNTATVVPEYYIVAEVTKMF
jgi:hypothetical protein